MRPNQIWIDDYESYTYKLENPIKFYVENDKYLYISNSKVYKKIFDDIFEEIPKQTIKELLETYKFDVKITMELTTILLED